MANLLLLLTPLAIEILNNKHGCIEGHHFNMLINLSTVWNYKDIDIIIRGFLYNYMCLNTTNTPLNTPRKLVSYFSFSTWTEN